MNLCFNSELGYGRCSDDILIFWAKMSFLIAVLKCLFCVEDDEAWQIRYHLQRSFDCNRVFSRILDCILCERERRHSFPVQRTNALLTSQANFGPKSSSSRAHNESYPSQTKSTYIITGETIDKKLVPVKLSIDDVVKSRGRDAVLDVHASKQPSIPNREKIANSSAPIKLSGNQIVKATDSSLASGNNKNISVPDDHALKQPSIPNREKIANSLAPIKPSGNQIVKSTDSSPVTGNKNSSVTSQFASASLSSLKPSSVASEASLSSVSVKPSEIYKKLRRLSSSSVHLGEEAKKGTSSRNDERHSYDFPPVAYSDGSNLSPSTFETGKFHSAQIKDQPLSSSLFEKSDSHLKPPLVASKPSLSSISGKLSEISPKVKSLSSSSPMGNIHRREDANKGTNSSNDNVPSASSKQSQYTVIFSFSSDSCSSALSTFETGKFHSAQKKNQPEKSHSPKPPPLSIKPTISLVSSSSLSPQEKTTYVWVERDASSTYVFPKEIKNLIEKDIVPGVLKMPLSVSSYKDYFHALLYAEDCYLEKWDGFEMKNVKVQLHEAAIYTRRGKPGNLNIYDDKDEKVFVAFELDKIRERRPFLISRDFVYLQPSNWKSNTFQGVIYRVVKSNLALAEFGEDFYSHHHPDDKYDVKFSFNRVCLKRAHQAIAAASDSLFMNLLFPNATPKHELHSAQFFAKNKYELEAFAIQQILRLQGAPPYLVEGPLVVENKQLSKTGVLIVEATLRILRADRSKKILLCAPVNNTCDMLMRRLKKEMSESDMFRANAAFRELDGVPIDILPSCLYEEEMKCFTCPSLEELKKYKVISSTFMSSFRLYGKGIMAGHFSHIFLVDASSATEPETMVPLANFANDTTIVVVTGAPRNHSGWIRSKIARENGLMTSYFERLRDRGLYKKLDPKFIAQL